MYFLPKICLLVIPFSVIVSFIASIEAGIMYDCLSTIGFIAIATEEKATKIH